MDDSIVAWILVLKYPTPSTAPRRGSTPRELQFDPPPQHTRTVKAGELFIFSDNDSEDESQFTYEGIRFALTPRQLPRDNTGIPREGTQNRVPFHRVEYYQFTLTAVFKDDVRVQILNERVVLEEMMELVRQDTGEFFSTRIGSDVGFTVEVLNSFAVEITFDSVPVPLIVRLLREHLQRQRQVHRDSPPLPPQRTSPQRPPRTLPPRQLPLMPR